MMTIDEMRKRKKELGYSYETIAHLSGVPLSTVQKILGGVTSAPRQKSVEALEQVLRAGNQPDDTAESEKWKRPADGQPDSGEDIPDSPDSMPDGAVVPREGMIREEGVVYGNRYVGKAGDGGCRGRLLSLAARNEIAYMRELTRDPKQGTYTADDRELLPEEQHTELIDGVLYDMAAPTPRHQLIVSKLWLVLQNQIEEESCSCEAVGVPMDISMENSPFDRLQPDIFVTCHPLPGIGGCLIGAPDLVIEVLSPSTKRKDQTVKTRKYAEAGVREYWMIDPETETITVLRLNSGTGAEHADMPYASLYGFHDRIPVGICSEGFAVDFAVIMERVRRAEGTLLAPPEAIFQYRNGETEGS